MRASDLKVLELLDFRADEGVIAFHDQRMLLYDADVIGILRRELVQTAGPQAAPGPLTRARARGRPPSRGAGGGRATSAATSRRAWETRSTSSRRTAARPATDAAAPSASGGPTGARSSSRTSSNSKP